MSPPQILIERRNPNRLNEHVKRPVVDHARYRKWVRLRMRQEARSKRRL